MGVLLSLTGDESFHSDGASNNQGLFSFGELFPGGYYLRPILKEWAFTPSSASIALKTGSNHPVRLEATRVAYSVHGRIHSLNGDAERGVVVVASSLDGSNQEEEAQSDSKGVFRLRGLRPDAEYKIAVRSSERVERAAPLSSVILMPSSDVEGINFITFRSGTKFDIAGVVDVADEHLSSIKVSLIVN